MWKIAKDGHAYTYHDIIDVKITVIKQWRKSPFNFHEKLGEFKSVDETHAFIREYVANLNKGD